MKTTINITALIVLVFLIVSCTNNPKETKTQKSDSTVTKSEHEHNDESEEISLNNHEKWQIKPEMIIHINKMKDDVAKFDRSSKKDFKNLANNLSESIDSLTSSCTMEGKAHDELHKWLVPFIDQVADFTEKAETTEAEILYSKIKTSLVEFDKFFE